MSKKQFILLFGMISFTLFLAFLYVQRIQNPVDLMESPQNSEERRGQDEESPSPVDKSEQKRFQGSPVTTEAVKNLSMVQDENATAFLIDVFTDQSLDYSIRNQALYEIVKRKDEMVFHAMKMVYERELAYPDRFQFMDLFAERADPQAIPTLIKALQYNTDESIRAHAASALAVFLEDHRVLNILKHYARTETSAEVKTRAISSLMRKINEDRRVFLRDLLSFEKDPQIREVIRDGLGD